MLLILVAAASLYYFLSPAVPAQAVAMESTLRQIDAGELVGFGDQGVLAWLGIPYAQAPVGNLRWRAPRPAQHWIGRREALTFGDACPQKIQGNGVQGSENCLFMNIWSPSNASEAALPVMFWIHGGGNSIGESSTTIYNGARLSREQKLVLVSINYRLGPLGWFRHPALREGSTSLADDSGNYGTLDIIMALKWVKNNISQFGGDPHNVTLFGESAGAFNVLSMVASPLANGLFHKAISESGGLNLSSVMQAENYLDDEQPGHRFSSREIVNAMLVEKGLASDRKSAKQVQM